MNSTTTKLSFNTCYYIRKLLLQSEGELKNILNKPGIFFSSKQELEQLLDSVYLEEVLQNILVVLYQEEGILNKVVEQLEHLVGQYQTVSKTDGYQEEVAIKRQIFVLLGLKRITITSQDILNALNQISSFSKNYLGNTLTTNTWQSARPTNDWLKTIQVERSAKFTCSNEVQQLDLKQLQLIQKWVSAFIQQSSAIIRDFAQIINEKRIGELPDGVLLLSATSYAAWVSKLWK